MHGALRRTFDIADGKLISLIILHSESCCAASTFQGEIERGSKIGEEAPNSAVLVPEPQSMRHCPDSDISIILLKRLNPFAPAVPSASGAGARSRERRCLMMPAVSKSRLPREGGHSSLIGGVLQQPQTSCN